MGSSTRVHQYLTVLCLCVAVDYVAALPVTSSDAKDQRFYCNETRILNKREDLSSRQARVLNFFAVPPSRECLSDDGRRSGVCFNPYECKIQNGEPRGKCARGFGVCCVFTATCGDEIVNNITYFVNPGFPSLYTDPLECEITIKKMAPHVSQLRLDFGHFSLGQPNRRTGNCESDIFIMGGATKRKKNSLKISSRELRLCGQNSGQHVYYDVENFDEAVSIRMNLTKEHLGRLWEIKVTQVRFNQRAPAGCLQYFTGTSGIIQTMNFADNGRHLANQDYSICMRQEEDFCSIAYEPCDENSFKIGPPVPGSSPLSGGQLGTNPVGSFPGNPLGTNPILSDPLDGIGDDGPLGGVEAVEDDPAEDPILEDDAGSGFGELNRIGVADEMLDLAKQSSNIPGGCADRIVMPCDSEEFIAADANGPGVCDLLHCGSSFCTGGEEPCRIESSTTPFLIQVQFGPGLREESPEDNLGMCLRYEQLACL